jgi:membrane protease YdiL (CAAX protease family)
MRDVLLDRLLRYAQWAGFVTTVCFSWWHTYHHQPMGWWYMAMTLGLSLLALLRGQLWKRRQRREQMREPFV